MDVLIWGTHGISTLHYQYFKSKEDAIIYIDKYFAGTNLEYDPDDYITYHANGVITRKQLKTLEK